MRTFIIFTIIIAAILIAYFGSHYLKRMTRPRDSLGRLLLYILACLLMIFVITFLMVFIITRFFPDELMR